MPRSRSGPRPIPCSSSISAPASTAASRRATGSPSTSSTPAAPPPGTSGSGRRSSRSRSGRSPRTRRRAAPSGSSSRPATRSRSSRARSRTRPRTRRARSSSRPRKLGTPLSFFAYLVADRPAAHADQVLTADVGDVPVALTIRVVGRRHGVVETGRRARRAGAAGAGGPDRPALAARWRPRHPRGGQPIHRRLRRAVRPVGRPDRGRLLRRRRRGPPRIGARLVQREPAGRSLGERGLRLVLRPRGGRRAQGQGRRRGPHAGPRGGPHPAQRLGPGRSRGCEDRVVRLRGLAGPRARHRRAGRRGRPARGVGRRVAPRRRVPATGARGRCHVGGRWRRGRARDGRRPRPIGAACSTCSRRTPRHRSTTCGGRGSRATRTWPCSTRGRPPGHATTRSSRRPGTGSCRAPFATRCAPGSSTRRPSSSTRPGRSSTSAPRSPPPPAAAGLTTPTTLRTAFESPDGFASATLEATAELEAIQRYDAAAAARPDESDPLVRPGPVGDDARRGAGAAPGPCSRPVT